MRESGIKQHGERAINANISHPAHTDGARIVMLFVGVVFLAQVIGLSVLWPAGLFSFWVWIAVCLFTVTAGYVGFRIERWAFGGKVLTPQEVRDEQKREQERRIAEAKANGDFDRFGADE